MGRPRKNPAAAGSGYVPKKIQALRGLSDIVADSDGLWSALLKRVSRMARVYGFERVEPPLLEDWRLYEAFYKESPQELAQFVSLPLAGQNAALRGSFLPGVLRAYYENKIYEQSPLNKWAFSGFTVRQTPKQELLQDQEFGFEVFGAFNHLTEAQVVGGVWELLQSLGLKEAVLEINHIGQDECQLAYSQSLHDYLAAKKYQLCDNCNENLQGRVLNVLRCDNLDCQALLTEAPTILDFLEDDSRKHFTNILEALDELGVPYQLNPLYAGSAGHSRTNLAIKYKLKNQTVVIGEGGYHENLMRNLCGKNYCSFGFVGSLGRIRQILESQKASVAREQKSDVFLVPLGELAAKKSLRLFRDLSAEKISVYDHFGNAGVKNQLKAAETFHAPIALIMGQKEAMDEMVILRDVKSGMQEVISYDKIVAEVKKRLGR